MISALILSVALAQGQDTSAYRDADARVLVERARAARDTLGQSIRSYTGVIKQRSAVTLRTPLKDRTLFRSESAARVRWSRDEEIIVKILGARQFHPGSEYSPFQLSDVSFHDIYDPTLDRLFFGMGETDDEDIWIDHPLIAGSERDYRFQTGDTITMTFPGGERVQVVELRVLPRTNRPRLITGSLWIEPNSGAIVKGAFRSSSKFDLQKDTDIYSDGDEEDLKHVPAMFKPFEVEITMITIEYSFWRLKHWMPRVVRMEGTARAGILVAPAAIEMSYQIEDVAADGELRPDEPSARAVLREWRGENANLSRTGRQNGRRTYTIAPEDWSRIGESPDIPPPIWETTPEFITEKDLRKMYGGLADLPVAPSLGTDVLLRWGPQRLDLVRYNRIEGLSLGARADLTADAGNAWAVGRIGVADLAPNVELGVKRETMRRTVELVATHGLAAVEPRSLDFGSSLGALALGRDDGEYYRSTGVRVSVAPPASRFKWYTLTVFGERHRAAERETDWSVARVLSGTDFRPNIVADRADLAGAELTLRGWWGTDPHRFQGGLELVMDGATGDFEYGRSTLTARSAFPIIGDLRGALEASAGTAEGTLPVQKHFFLGGAPTLRGYDGSARVGPSFARARAELAQTLAGYSAGVALFADAGWAGERTAFDSTDALLSAGIGLTILDGLFRIDLARALRAPTGWRLELHLDSVL